MPTTNVGAAIDLFTSYTLGQFDTAYQSATATTPAPEATDAEKQAKKAQAGAVNQMTSSLQQLVQMEKLKASLPHDDPGREAIVQLMKDTQTTARAVCDQIKLELAPVADAAQEAARLRRLSSLAGVLDSLAKVSPVAVWERSASTSNGT